MPRKENCSGENCPCAATRICAYALLFATQAGADAGLAGAAVAADGVAAAEEAGRVTASAAAIEQASSKGFIGISRERPEHRVAGGMSPCAEGHGRGCLRSASMPAFPPDRIPHDG